MSAVRTMNDCAVRFLLAIIFVLPIGAMAQGLGEAQSGRYGASSLSTRSLESQQTFDESSLPQAAPLDATGAGQGIPVISNRVRGDRSGGIGGPASARDRLDELQGGASSEPQRRQFDQRQQQTRLGFQDYILQSTGKLLPIFGADLFRQVPSTFAPVNNIPVTPDYTIGPGDEIQIRAWGQVEIDYVATVDRTGAISLPRVGIVSLAGVRYQELTNVLKAAVGRIFRGFEISATLGRLRSIQVLVVGQAKRPGTYTLSSLSTLVTTLFATGGPAPTGSLRKIQLRRAGKVVTELDVYSLLISGDKSSDVQMLPGDIIYIPPIGDLAAIAGDVKNPAVYELKGNVTLSDLIDIAGGLQTTADGTTVSVERIDGRRTRSVEQVSLDPSGRARAVKDGDFVTIHSVSPRFSNAVTLRGNVAQPGRYPWRPGMRIRDLIPSKDALLSREYWLRRGQMVGMDPSIARVLQGSRSAGVPLGVTELLEPLSAGNGATIGDAIQRQAVQRDSSRVINQMQANENASGGRGLESKVERSGLLNQVTPLPGEVNWEYAVVERVSEKDLSGTLIPFNLGKAILEGDASSNLLLAPGDVVTIFSREDLQVPQAKQTRFVRVEGEVASPGVYQLQPGETVRQLLQRIGGVTPSAYLFGTELIRETVRQVQQKGIDEAVVRLERDVQSSSLAKSQNATSPEEVASLKQQAENQQSLITRLRQVKATGRMVLELSETSELKDIPDVILEDSDRLYVPARPSMVNVFGAVFNENSFLFKSDKKVSDYLVQAGGPTKRADAGGIYLIRADGTVVSRRQSGSVFGGLNNLRPAPGDSIVVPEDLEYVSWTKSLKDLAQIFYQFGLGAAAIKVLRN